MSFSLRYKNLIISFITLNSATAQGVTIGSNNPPSSSAGLDLDFTNGGLLLPRLTTTQRNAINNPQAGLQIYNLDTDCLELFFQQGGWKPVNCGCTAFPNATFTAPSGSGSVTIALTCP